MASIFIKLLKELVKDITILLLNIQILQIINLIMAIILKQLSFFLIIFAQNFLFFFIFCLNFILLFFILDKLFIYNLDIRIYG